MRFLLIKLIKEKGQYISFKYIVLENFANHESNSVKFSEIEFLVFLIYPVFKLHVCNVN